MPDQKRIVLGVTGGVAAYKAIELSRILTDSGFVVDVVLTRAAVEFVAASSFEAVTGRKPITTLFDQSDQAKDSVRNNKAMPHIELVKDAAALLVAPATANVIAKIAHGIADDALTTSILASKTPLILAPAMNEAMWLNAATQANVKTLRRRGVSFIGPVVGDLACGDIGLGRMTEPDDIAKYLYDLINAADKLRGRRVMVTAGGTREPLDTARFIGNRSSGKMGYALAAACAGRGAEVTLVSAPTALEPPGGVRLVSVTTAAQMAEAVLKDFNKVDVVIMAAAVGDYRFAEVSPKKLKKGTGDLTVKLTPNIDILAELGRVKKGQILIGFAAETDNIAANARQKLKKKRLDMIVANDILRRDRGFDSDDNEAIIITGDREIPVALTSKRELAEIITDLLAAMLDNRTSGTLS